MSKYPHPDICEQCEGPVYEGIRHHCGPYAEDVREAIKYVRLANENAFTWRHPAYREAEQRLRRLSTAKASIVLRETGGLRAVIGRAAVHPPAS